MIVVSLLGAYGLELSWPQWGLIVVAGLLAIVIGRYLAPKLERRLDPLG
jgi:hypothetical protein